MTIMPYSKGWHSVRRKPSGKWEARYADETGKARGKCFMTKEQAKRYAEDKARNVADAAVGLAILAKDLKEAATTWLATFRDEGTLRIYNRHLDHFYETMKAVRFVGDLTEDVMIAYDSALAEERWPDGRARHNPGGRRHILKTFKAFVRFCVRRKWLLVDPFLDFKLPRSEFHSRALDAGEFARLTTPDPRYEVDEHLRDMYIVMQETTIRSETLWALTPMDFRAPDLLRVKAQKDQDPVWLSLTAKALEIVTRRLMGRRATQRLFDYFPSVDAMRQASRKKARREGLAGVRPHDAGKVTRVTELLAEGYTPKELEHITNTNWRTLMEYYAKADRSKTFEKYQRRDLPQTYPGPKTGTNGTEQPTLEATPAPKSNSGFGAV